MRIKKMAVTMLATVALATSATAQDGGSVDASMGTCAPDSYEPNDSAATAKPVTAGTITSLTGCADDQNDWYSITVPANNGVVVDIAFIDDQADLDLSMYDAAASTSSLHSSSSTTDNERVFYELFDSETQILIKVKNFNYRDGRWAPYSMTITLHSGGYDPCAPDDNYERNDDFASAAAIAPGAEVNGLVSCDTDWYSFNVPAGNGVVVDASYARDAVDDIDLYLYEEGATNSSLHSDYGSDGATRVFNELFEQARQVYVRVPGGSSRTRRIEYSLTITLHPGGYDPCDPDDSSEPNDDFASAATLATGSTVSNLIGCDTDIYSFTVPAGNGVVVEMSYPTDGPSLSLYLYDAAATSTAIHSSYGSGGAARVYWELFDTATTVLVRVPGYYSTPRRVNYSLTVTLHPGGYDPCATDDSYEPNEDAASAAAITAPGVVDSLMGCDEWDWYSFNAPANKQVEVTMDFTDANADLDLYIYEASDPDSPLDYSTGTDDQEVVTVDAYCGDTPLLIKVRNYDFEEGMSDYTLTLTFTDQICDRTSGDGGTSSTDGSGGAEDGSSSGSDAGTGRGVDSGTDETTPTGCGCQSLGASRAGLLVLGLLGLVATLRRRRSA